jgi:hypothetical protein
MSSGLPYVANLSDWSLLDYTCQPSLFLSYSSVKVSRLWDFRNELTHSTFSLPKYSLYETDILKDSRLRIVYHTTPVLDLGIRESQRALPCWSDIPNLVSTSPHRPRVHCTEHVVLGSMGASNHACRSSICARNSSCHHVSQRRHSQNTHCCICIVQHDSASSQHYFTEHLSGIR